MDRRIRRKSEMVETNFKKPAFKQAKPSDRELMRRAGFKSGKSYRRFLKKKRPVAPQYFKDGRLVPTKRIRTAVVPAE